MYCLIDEKDYPYYDVIECCETCEFQETCSDNNFDEIEEMKGDNNED